MRTTGRTRRVTRIVGSGLLIGALTLGLAATTATAEESEDTPTPSAEVATPTPEPEVAAVGAVPVVALANEPFGRPIVQETNFARPVRALSSDANSDFSQLEDLERLIRGSYYNPVTKSVRPENERVGNLVLMSMSRMEESKRVGRELIAAAAYGVPVRFVHGKDSQSAASRSLQKRLNAVTYKGRHTGAFIICAKGKSLACLSNAKGGIIHTKSLIVDSTFTRTNEPANGAVWFGSPNIGGPSGEHTWNNGQTIYNDKKIYLQTRQMFNDLLAERNIGNNYPGYIAGHHWLYGYDSGQAAADGYKGASPGTAFYGVFYSNLSNYTVYASPIAATPVNGRDPIENALDRIIPGDDCTIRIQENRWKYRRLAIAEKLVDLANGGCTISAVAYQDDLKVNRVQHCQIYIRICRPILDELRRADIQIDIAWAKPHDKVILIDAKLRPNPLNPDELTPDGATWPAGGKHVTMVQAGSAALTGSNLLASDEVTTESLDPQVFADYLEHWRAINRSTEFRPYPN